MYIKLTRADGRPIWLNASFIVTVEPMQNGGAIVVPIGDGLDYEVRETPESVLAMLDGAPPAEVVPVPPPKALAPQPEDVSPEDFGGKEPDGGQKAEEAKKPARKPAARKKTATTQKQTQKAKEPAPAAKASASLAAEDIKSVAVKLKANKARTENRLRNFIKNCYKKADEAEVTGVVEALKKDGYITVDDNGRISWAEMV